MYGEMAQCLLSGLSKVFIEYEEMKKMRKKQLALYRINTIWTIFIKKAFYFPTLC